MCRSWPLSALLAFAELPLVANAIVATAAPVEDLYQAQTLVTGQGEANRALGFGRCLRDVLVKVSGDVRLAGDARIDALARDAGASVNDFHYRDLLAGIPIHDEQGSRDRPYELTVDFRPTRVDDALHSLGAAPWTADRPRLVLFIRMRNGAADYLLASDGERGIDQREALAAAARQRGMPMLLPSRADLAAAELRLDKFSAVKVQLLSAVAAHLGGDLALAGRVVGGGKTPGWTADWRLIAADKTYEWHTRTGTFDDTFRGAIGGAAQILSGHGEPK